MVVRTTPRCCRMNSLRPRCSSSSRICRLTADGVTHSSAAASVMLHSRPATSNVRTALRGGKPSMPDPAFA
ncbi:Uncharacterised protein [Bordetella pertussis]|nr:Uncharacterised protein [Bordetella pertussis]